MLVLFLLSISIFGEMIIANFNDIEDKISELERKIKENKLLQVELDNIEDLEEEKKKIYKNI